MHGIQRILEELQDRAEICTEISKQFDKVDKKLGGDILDTRSNLALNIFIKWKHTKHMPLMRKINQFLKDNKIHNEESNTTTYYEFQSTGKRFLEKIEIKETARKKERYMSHILKDDDALYVITLLSQFKV